MQEIVKTMMIRPITTVGKYIMLMGRTFARPERMHMFFKQYLNEMVQLGVNSIGIVLLISFFIGAVITIQIKLNIESPWMPRFVVGYTTREIMLLEFSSSIMCLILSGKVGSNIASEIGTMRVTQQIDALEIMGVNSAGYLILPKIIALMTMIPFFKARISERDDPALLSAQFTESFYGDECRFGRNAGAPCRFSESSRRYFRGSRDYTCKGPFLLCFIGKSIGICA